MEKLPSEIFALILANQTRRALLTFRLVNKRLAAEAAPNLFRTITAWISLRSLQKLTSLSEHPQLSLYVKTLVISPLRIIDRGDLTAFEDLVRSRHEVPRASMSSEELSVARCMVSYQSYIHEQRLLRTRRLGRNLLSQIFNNFAHLEEIAFPSLDEHTGAQELIDAFGISRCTEVLTMDFEVTLRTTIEALAASHAKIKLLKLGDDRMHHLSVHGCACHGSPESSSSRCARLSNLHQRISDFAICKALGNPLLQSCRHALSELREFEMGAIVINGNPVGVEEALSLSRITKGIRNLISLAPNLENITLKEIELCYTSTRIRPSLSDIFSNLQKRKLRKVDIDAYDTTERAMIGFFKRYSNTLTEVRFGHMSIIDAGWSSALSKLRDSNFPRLVSFVLDFCLRQELGNRVSVHDYVLRKTDEDPTVEKGLRPAELP